MCGIGGMLGEPDTAVLHRMNQIQQHRGPDDQGVWSDGQLGFSHARLAIVDVVSSQQPCLLYTSPSPRDGLLSRMPSSA